MLNLRRAASASSPRRAEGLSAQGRSPPRGCRTGKNAMSQANQEGGSVQIGPTDQGMVRLILDTASGVFELDFPPEEARQIAEEIIASAQMADGSAKGRRRN